MIPADDGETAITWERFAAFIDGFGHIEDAQVCPRYSFGELRLTRLNQCARLFLGKLTFHHIRPQWSTYLGGLLAPLLSVFALVSVVLSAMQVGLASSGAEGQWVLFYDTAKRFSAAVIIFATVVIGSSVTFVGFLWIHDMWFARSVLRRKAKGVDLSWKVAKSGVV